MKKDAFYFPHDSNARDDPKCVLLIEQLGLEGYGIYWVLIETLRDQPGYSYPVALLPALARRYNTTPEKVKTVVCNYDLFAIRDDRIFFSPALIDRMKPLDEKRKKLSEAGQTGNAVRWQIATRSPGDRDAITTRSQVNKKRTEKSKVKNIIDVSADTMEHRSKLFYDSLVPFLDNYGKGLIREFYDYWSEPDHSHTRMRFELEKTWDTERRLKNWQRKKQNYENRSVSKKIVPTTTEGYRSTI